MGLFGSLQHAWNVFRERDPTKNKRGMSFWNGISSTRPDRLIIRPSTERSIIAAIYNRIAIDVASIPIHHVRVDKNGRYKEQIYSSLEDCLSVEANKDQTGRELIQDVVLSLCDEGCVAIVPVDTNIDPINHSFSIESLRTGKIVEWAPDAVLVNLYNDSIGERQDVWVPKKICAIIENPLYAVMNEPNSTLKRLIRKMNLLDAVDEQTGSNKLDVIIQLPYSVKSDIRRQQADARLKDIEMQLTGSKYGIAYIDSTEHVTQLNRAAENNLLDQVDYLTQMLYSQLGLDESVFNGTADEKTMLNYHNRTIEPILSAITNNMHRKFLTKTARTQGQAIMFFRDPFRLVPVEQIAEIADKFTRNEVLSPNEIRAIIGYKPVDDERADELRNRNLNQESGSNDPVTVNDDVSDDIEDFDISLKLTGESVFK